MRRLPAAALSLLAMAGWPGPAAGDAATSRHATGKQGAPAAAPAGGASSGGPGLLSTPASGATGGRAVVAIGSNLGLAEEEPLAFAVEDARRVGVLFEGPGQTARARVRVLANPSVAAVLETLAQLAGAETLFLYFSGHGDAGRCTFRASGSRSSGCRARWRRRAPG